MGKKIVHETMNSLADSSRSYTASLADQFDALKARCTLLTGTDRVLMELLLRGNCSYSDMSALLGISEPALSRRIRRLVSSAGGRYWFFIQHCRQLSPAQWKVARLAFLEGLSLRHIARHTGFSIYRVRQITGSLKSRMESKSKQHNGRIQAASRVEPDYSLINHH